MIKRVVKYRFRPFTVMEMIVALGIFSGMLLLLMRFYSSAQTIWTTSEKRTAVHSAARTAFDLIDSAYRSSSTEGFEFNSKMDECTFFGKVPFAFFPDSMDKDYKNLPPEDRLVYAKMTFKIKSDALAVRIDAADDSSSEEIILVPGVTDIKFTPLYRVVSRTGSEVKISYDKYDASTRQSRRPDELGVEMEVIDERTLDYAKIIGKSSDDQFMRENTFIVFRLLALPINPLSADKPEGSTP